MHRSALLTLGAIFAAPALAAENNTVGLWMPFWNGAVPKPTSLDPIRASVISADAQATTYALHPCDYYVNTDGASCDVTSNIVIQGPSTYVYIANGVDSHNTKANVTELKTVDCTAKSQADVVTCTASVAMNVDGTVVPGNLRAVSTLSGFAKDRIPVTVTAGLEKLSATPGSGAATVPTPTGKTSSAAAAVGARDAVLLGLGALVGVLML